MGGTEGFEPADQYFSFSRRVLYSLDLVRYTVSRERLLRLICTGLHGHGISQHRFN